MYCTCIPVLLMEAISQRLSLFSSKGKAPTAHGVRRGLRCSPHDRLYAPLQNPPSLETWRKRERERGERNGGEIEGGRVMNEAHTIILILTSLHDLLDMYIT